MQQRSGQNKNHRNKKRHHGGRGPRRDQNNPQGRHNRNEGGQQKSQGGDRSQQGRQSNGHQPPANSKYGRVIENHIPKRYGILFFDTFAQAKADILAIADKAKACDQLNIVIKAEGDMNDPDLKQFGMVFAGAAWHLIHTRRVEEGWYNEPR